MSHDDEIRQLERIVNEAARVDADPADAMAIAAITDVILNGRPGAVVPRGLLILDDVKRLIASAESKRDRLNASLSEAVGRKLGLIR